MLSRLALSGLSDSMGMGKGVLSAKVKQMTVKSPSYGMCMVYGKVMSDRN